MFSKHTPVSLAGAAFLAMCTWAFAADVPKPGPVRAPVVIVPNAIVQSNNQISLDAAISHLHYVEAEPPDGFLDSENGWLPGLVASATFMGNRSATGHHLYVSGSFRFLTGNTAYRDFQGFADSDESLILNEDARLGVGYDVGAHSMITPYLGLGARQWSRDVAPHIPGGYDERYSHEYVGGGLLLQYAHSPRWVWSAYGLLGTTFEPRLRVTHHPFSLFTPLIPAQFTLQLASAMIVMAGASADVALNDRWHANFGVDYEQFDYGHSLHSLFPPINVYEPHSRTQQLTLKAGLGLAF